MGEASQALLALAKHIKQGVENYRPLEGLPEPVIRALNEGWDRADLGLEMEALWMSDYAASVAAFLEAIAKDWEDLSLVYSPTQDRTSEAGC